MADEFNPQISVGDAANTPQPAPQSPLVTQDMNRIEYETDKRGRKIGAKRVSWSDRFDMSIMLGEHASNNQVLQQAMLVASITEFAGEQWARPMSLSELRARIQRLDFEGLEAIANIQERFMPKSEGAGEAVKN